MYEAPPKEPEEDEVVDLELQELLEDLVEQDQINSKDLRSYKADLNEKIKKKLKRLQQAAAKERKKVAAAKEKKKKTSTFGKKFLKKTSPEPEPLSLPAAPAEEPPAPVPVPLVPAEAEAFAGEGDPERLQCRRMPRPTAGWRVMRVPGGWVRYSQEKGRLDSHCRYHDGCKMDRTLRKGSIGLALAWLQAGQGGDKAFHVTAKETLSSAEGFEARSAARADFRERAAASPLIADIVQCESNLRDGDQTEPPTLACPSVQRDLENVYAAASA